MRLSGKFVKKERKNFTGIKLLILFNFVLFIGGFTLYNNSLMENMRHSACNTLIELSEQQKFNFYSKMEDDIYVIKNLAITASLLPEDYHEVVRGMQALVKNTSFDSLLITDVNGRGIVDSGSVVDISSRPYLEEVLKGETVISAPVSSLVDGQIIVPLATPVYVEGKISGILVAYYSSDKMKDQILPSYKGNGFAFVTDRTGEILVSSGDKQAIFPSADEETNLFDVLSQAQFIEYSDYDMILENINHDKSSCSIFKVSGKVNLMYNLPLDVNDWQLFVVVPQTFAESQRTVFLQNTTLLITFLTFLYGIFMVCIILQQYKARNVEQKYTAELVRISCEDELTGVPTLVKFKLEASGVLEKNPEKRYLLVQLDIRNFKLVNQMYSYDIGNKLLCALAACIRETIRMGVDFFARLNADDFVVLYELNEDDYEYKGLHNCFIEKVKTIMGIDFHFNFQLAAGCYTLEPGEERNIAEALEKVNLAHRQAKAAKTGVCYYSKAMYKEMLYRQKVADSMEAALDSGAFILYLQPKYDLKSNTLKGAEALARWLDNGRIIFPGSFIPIFEENGSIVRLDLYIFEKTCIILKEWIDKKIQPISISVNFSRHHLNNTRFCEMLCTIADKYFIPHYLLEIELTESVMLDNEKQLIKLLDQLHKNGFTISMDDFGTGYSSLGLLKNIPLDVLKIDRSFFLRAEDELKARAVIENVMRLARDLHLKTVAEGVETKEQIDFLRDIGCDMVQGYYYGKPMIIDKFEGLLRHD